MTAYIVCLAIGSVLAAVYCLILLTSGKKYEQMVQPLIGSEYRLPELYTFGFALLGMFKKGPFKHSFSSKTELKRRKCISILKGDQYTDYYLQVEYAKRVSLVAPIVIASFFIVPFAEEVLTCPLMLIIAGALYAYIGREPQKKIDERAEIMLSQFPDIVSKLALLINAGMIMRQAWEKVAFSGDSIIYEQMRLVCSNLNNGMSETEAYFEFGNNCVVPEIKKFASTIVQGIIKGNKDLSIMLKEQSSEVWGVKMNLVKRQGDAAVSKLIAPMMIIFIGILIMVVVPIFTNMNV